MYESKEQYLVEGIPCLLDGWDTDCNGTTIGSILGASLGASALPDKWISPLNDTLYADVSGFHPIAISECAQRSYKIFRKLQHYNDLGCNG